MAGFWEAVFIGWLMPVNPMVLPLVWRRAAVLTLPVSGALWGIWWAVWFAWLLVGICGLVAFGALAPPFILQALGKFDLDPCACSEPRPWPTADDHYTVNDNGLRKPWQGRVWLNPPYGSPTVVGPWMRRLADHGRGTALIFARTETALFFETVWRKASACLFLEGRLFFHYPDGRKAGNNSGAPSVLIAYGNEDAEILRACGLAGAFVDLRERAAA